MADVPITYGSGQASVAADTVSGSSYQKIKLYDGTLGSTNAAIVNSDGTINARISGSVATAGGTFTGSVSGTVGASIIGQLPAGTAPIGSVATLQGTNPWVIVGSVYGSGSVVAFQGGAQTTSIVGGASVFQAGAWTTSIVGGASVFQAGPWTTSIMGGASVFQAGTWSTSVMTNIITSIATAGQVMGSVAALQATNPWNIAGSVAAFIVGNSSVITVAQGSVATVIVGGSISATFTPPANQSVSGTVQADIRGSVAVAIISGSIAATFTPPANQSVSGTVQTDVRSSVAVVIIGGSIAASFTPPANQSVSGTVNIGTGGPVSVVGTMSVLGVVPVTLTANSIPATASILVGVTANTNGSVLTTTGYPQALIQITSGPGASITGAINFEGTLDGTQFVPIQGYNLATLAISSMATLESNWAFNTAGLQGIRARVSNWTVGSITARAVVSPSDARPFSTYQTGGVVSVIGTAGASIIGQLPAGTAPLGSVAVLQGTMPWTIGSVYGNISGSVAAFVVGSSSIITRFADSSILAVPVGSIITVTQGSSILAVPVGSVITVLQGASIVGTYAEDAASASGDKGFLVMGARNDTLASVTSNDGDYSSHVVGPAGELIAANAPLTKWVSGTASMLGGVPMTCSVTVIAAQGSSIFTYITGIQVANLGSASVLVSFGGATSSYIGYTIAPAGGGSNIYFQNGLKTNANAAFSASVSGAASVYVAAQGFISKT